MNPACRHTIRALTTDEPDEPLYTHDTPGLYPEPADLEFATEALTHVLHTLARQDPITTRNS